MDEVANSGSRLAALNPVMRATVEVTRIELVAMDEALERMAAFRAHMRREATLKAFGIRVNSRLVDKRTAAGWIYEVIGDSDKDGVVFLRWTGLRQNLATKSTPFLTTHLLDFEDIFREDSGTHWELLTY
jgi:hypothetical protein